MNKPPRARMPASAADRLRAALAAHSRLLGDAVRVKRRICRGRRGAYDTLAIRFKQNIYHWKKGTRVTALAVGEAPLYDRRSDMWKNSGCCRTASPTKPNCAVCAAIRKCVFKTVICPDKQPDFFTGEP